MSGVDLTELADAPFDSGVLAAGVDRFVSCLPAHEDRQSRLQFAASSTIAILDGLGGESLQDRWETLERDRWPRWDSGVDRPAPAERWTWGLATLILSRAVRPGWPVLRRVRLTQWLRWLCGEDPLLRIHAELELHTSAVSWSVGGQCKRRAVLLGIRLLLAHGYRDVREISDDDLRTIPVDVASGVDVLDTVLCDLGILARTPLRGHQRRMRGARLTPAQLAGQSRIPGRFRQAHVLYLENYAERVSDVYATTRHKHNALEHLWVFLDERYPEISSCAEVRRAHLLAFIPHAKRLVRDVRRDSPGTDPEDRMTAHQWLTTVRCFFGDICTWSLEDGSPFAGLAPPAVPLERHDLKGQGFEKIRRRQAKRAGAAILDLEREVPRIRAIALRRWHEAEQTDTPADLRGQLAESTAFWDWAVLELLVQSGVRIEEACELTTLDVLRRQQSDGKVYYLLHVKPSKYERARVIPIGDGLGRVIAEIIRHVKRFYRTDHVPSCDHWDEAEKRARPRAPYLLQGAGRPSALAMQGIRSRLARLSRLAETKRADGQPLILRLHDCRRLFASELLNNSVAPHVIQALLGHAHIDTVMIYAKLYPSTLVEDYRKAVRSSYTDFHGPDSLRAPTHAEWEEFSRSCNLRDMGTHLCALPTGDHCSRGLVCLGCSHAQPKKTAAPVFTRMLASHQRALDRAREGGEAGQLAARELEIHRIEGALRRADELTGDVAAALEAAA